MRVGVDGRSLAGAGRGVAQYTVGMVGAMAAAETAIELRLLLPRGASLPTALARTENVGAVRHPAPSRLLHGAGAVVRRPRLERLIGDVDVVWLPAPAPVAVDRGTPLVLSVHDLGFADRPQDLTRYERLWHRLVRIDELARRATRIAAVTHDTARRAQDRYRLGDGRVVVVGAGAGDPGPAVGADELAAVRARYGLPERYFLFVGALEPRKALDRLLAGHARARAAGLDAALVIAGAGRLEAALVSARGGRLGTALVNADYGRLGRAGVHVIGRVDRAVKAALYAGALAVVLPSWLEGYGYPPLEGYAHGTPAIVSDVPALRETAGAGARYVPAGDERALAAALGELAADPALRSELAAHGAAALAARSWPACGRRMAAVLAAAAATEQAAPPAVRTAA
jgi:glycosyltransferase involved in cell wall biosynthesis